MSQQGNDVCLSREHNVNSGNKTPLSALEEENSYNHETSRKWRSSDVAIIGMSGRFAGSANLEAFWSHLQAGENCIEEIQREGWETCTLNSDPDSEQMKTSQVKWGGMLEHIDQFDPLFFHISPLEAARMDPQQRLFLQEAYRAFEDAGYAAEQLSDKKVGVFVGARSSDYKEQFPHNRRDWAARLSAGIDAHLFLGNDMAVLAGRISSFLNLKGPALTIDTASSSSLVAIHLACESIQIGEAEMALAGGVFVMSSPEYAVMAAKTQMLSPDGTCRTFDKSANGIVLGEGVGTLVLKPLDAAIEDGDHIYGIIVGSAVNQDGKTLGITAPNMLSQKALLSDLYQKAAIDPATVSYIEAHGTGSKLGDPIEVQALTEAFRLFTAKTQFCAIGSHKPNVGHTITSAGIAGVFKVLLAMKYQQIPPTINIKEVNPQIDFQGSPFFLNTELREWKGCDSWPRRAGVSSFGLSGTNCHVILEESPLNKKTTDKQARPAFFFPLSAKTKAALSQKVVDLVTWLEKEGDNYSVEDVSSTLVQGRNHFSVRSAVVASDTSDLLHALREIMSKDGSEHEGINEKGKSLVQTEPLLYPYGNWLLKQLQENASLAREEYQEKLVILAGLYVKGYSLDWGTLFKEGKYHRVPLPTYPFLGESYWIAERLPSREAQKLGQQVIVALRTTPPWSPADATDLSPRHGRPQGYAPTGLRPLESVEGARDKPQHVSTDKLYKALARVIADLLRVRLEDINPDTELSEYGFDSITFMEFAHRLNQSYKLDLTAPLFYEHSTISRLAQYLQTTYTAILASHFTGASPHVVTQQDLKPRPMTTDEMPPIEVVGRSKDWGDRNGSLASPIAIIGMSGVFPQAPDVQSLWKKLLAGKDCIGEIPASRWDWRAYFGNPATETNKTNVKWAGIVEDVELFDPLFFGISPREAEQMDPQQRLLMMYVWKSIEDAGYSAESLSGTNTALFVGTMSSGYSERLSRANVSIEGYSSTGQAPSVGPNRMSYFLNLHGPSEAIETACSSSLIAIHRGVNAIESGQSAMAIVGGVNTLVSPELHISYSKAGMLCDDGRCKTFSARANGYVRGEGVGVLVLKKLSLAVQDGDHIYGVIRGSAENHGGRASSLTAPNPRAQADLLIAAYRKAGIDPRTVGYIEAHGTGTALGDPIEINGLKTAWSELGQTIGEGPVPQASCGIGSLKSNIGHLEWAAGVAGVIKVLLQMQHKKLVKSLHCEQINPYIQLEGSPFYIVQETRNWEALQDSTGKALPRRAGVSSFGFGGANAHVVLEEYVPSTQGTEGEASSLVCPSSFLIVLSAKNEERLREQVRQLLAWMQEGSCVQEPLGLYNLAYTLQMGREAMEERLALQVGSPVELEEKLGRYLHNPQEETGDWYRGQVKRYKDLVVSLSADEELQEAIVKWLQRGKYERLLEWWVKGLEIPWQYLYTVGAGLAPALPQRLSLPTYPFGKERYWVDLIAVGQPGKSQSLSSRNTTSQEEVCQTNASATARTMFLTPIWQKDAIVGPHIAQETALPVTLILLCDLPDIAASSIQAQMATGGHCRSLSSAQSRRELRFQDAVVQLIQELQHLLQAKSVEPMLVQVVVADREEPSRLSALAGVLKTAQQEYPQLAGQLIEVEGEADEETLLAKLRENQYRSQQLHIRYRDGQRWVKLWQEHPAPIQTRPKESSFPWKEGGCYLIIGGAGGLARLFVQEIAQQVQEATIFLIGRSELDASQRAALMPTGSGGISIDYQQVDVSDGSAVHALMQRVQQKSGHLDGIIHAAGVLRDSLLRNKTAEEVLAVLSPKVIGVEVLDEQSREMALDFFVLCSSFVAVGGNVGQADYAGANAYLDAFAHTRRAQVLAGKRQGETVSINWPLWEEGGMHIESAKREMMRERLGLDEMGTEIGMMTLYQALALRQAQVVVLYGQVERIRQQWLQGHVSPVSANLVGEGRQGQSLGPLQYGGTSEADERIVGAGSEPRTIPTAPAFGPIDTSLSQLAPMGASPTPAFPTDKLCEALAHIVSDLLNVPLEQMDAETPLPEYGFDSITFAQFAHRLNQSYQLDLTPPLFYEYSTISRLGAYLQRAYAAILAPYFAAASPVTSELAQELMRDETNLHPKGQFSKNEAVGDPGSAPVRLLVEADEGKPSPDVSLRQQCASIGCSVAPHRSVTASPIAIIGMSGNFPQASDVQSLWSNLLAGRDCIGEIPASRWDWRTYFGGTAATEVSQTNLKWAGVVEEVELFDPLFFGISPREAELMDPQQRLLMTYVWKAIEDAGYTAESLSGSNTALFVGTASSGYYERVARVPTAIESYSSTGQASSMGPNRMSYFLNLHGPSEAIDTACSSSLVALQRGVTTIESGQCDMVIVGGVNTLVSPGWHVSVSKVGMLSEDGRCKTFSAAADGYVRSEGVGMLVLKRLDLAEQDGDHIYGVIVGSAENHGGRASSLTAPNPRAQADLLIAAYRKAGVDPRTVGYIEAHGTGTALGDPIEINGLKTAWSELSEMVGEGPMQKAVCGIGSVKSNIGHLELAAGVAGVIKVLLQLQHKKLVKSLHCERINPYIQLEASPFYIVQENREWEALRDRAGNPLPRRAGVSSFGFGGTNAHVVLEEYIPKPQVKPLASHVQRPALIVLSARNEEQLHEQVRQLLVWVETGTSTEQPLGLAPDQRLQDVAYTLQVGREAMEERLALQVSSLTDLQEQLRRFLQKPQEKGNWYRGQVTQHKEMVTFFRTDEELQEVIDRWFHRGKYEQLLQGWVKGLTIDWKHLYGEDKPCRISLPTYPFARERYWIPIETFGTVRGSCPLPTGSLKTVEETRTALLVPSWKEEAIARQRLEQQAPPQQVAPAGWKPLVLLCNLPSILASRIEAQMASGGGCYSLTSSQSRREQRFQDAVLQLIGEIQHLQQSRPAGSVLVQVVVADIEEPSMLEALVGVLKTAQQEYPKLRGQLIEVEEKPEEGELLAWLSENLHRPHEPHIRYSCGKRWVMRWQEVLSTGEASSPTFPPAASSISKVPWKEGGCYLISGGAGGLARLFVQEIVQQVREATVILFGRSVLDASQRAAVGGVPCATGGIRIDYQQGDVSDGPAVHGLIQRVLARHGHLDGIIHAAGVLRDGLLLNKTPEEVQAVLAPKVLGVEHLDEASREIPLDFFVLCSSLSAVGGSVGQADYAAANSYLDAFAHARAAQVVAGQRQGKTVSINWPLWKAGGMQVEAEAKLVMQEQMGLEPMETEAGMKALYQALALGQAQVIVLHGDLPKIRERMFPASLLNYSYQACVSEEPHLGQGQTLSVADRAELHKKTLQQMQVLFAEVTKLSMSEIDADEPFENYGIDSIMMTYLSQRLLTHFKSFSRTFLYEYPTISALVEYLLESHPQECIQWVGQPVGTTPPHSRKDRVYPYPSSALGVSLSRTEAEPLSPTRVLPPSISYPLPSASCQASIALIGISGRYPQANNLEEYWEILKAGKSCITEIPRSRWDWEDYYQNSREQAMTSGKSYSKWGAFLADFDQFDPLFFQMTPSVAEEIDPQERLFLEECWKALEDAGYTPSTLSAELRQRTGVFGGMTKQGFHLSSTETPGQFPSTSFASLVNRVSYYLNLQGPSTVVDTMCSSALVAIHEACEYIRQGKGDMALAGGVNVYVHPATYIGLSRSQTISDGAKCLAFGRGGQGFVPGEGVGVIVLKAYDQALKDGDGIYAVIRGSAVNHNGRTKSYTTPDPNQQAAVIQQALSQQSLDPRTVSYIEAAANGSELADTVEMAALRLVFGSRSNEQEGYRIGSVKPTLGHAEAASGMAQLTKVILSLKYQTLVPTGVPEDFHPITPLNQWPFQLQREVSPWKRLTVDGDEVPRRAGITSVGAGGVNAHLILEEYIPETESVSRPIDLATPIVFVLSAKNKQRLSEYVKQWIVYLKKQNVDLENVAYTLQIGREKMSCRLAIVAYHQEELLQQLEQWMVEQKNTHNCYFSASRTSTDEREHQTRETGDTRSEFAKLWVAGSAVPWNDLHQGKQRVRITGLPTYPFKRRTCWIDRSPADHARTESTQEQSTTKASDQGCPNKAVEFYTLIAEQSTRSLQIGYLTFCPFTEKLPGFSMSQTFLHPEKYPDEISLIQVKQEETRQVLFYQEDFQRVQTFLDIGCGYGTDVIQVAELYPHITAHGFTITQAQAKLGQHRIAELSLSPRAQIWQKDSSKDPFPGQYDLIIGIEVTFHMRNKAGLFQNIASSLNEHGKVLLIDYIANLRGAIIDPRIEISIPTEKEWLDLLTEHHLIIDEIIDVSAQIANFLYDPEVRENVKGLPKVVQDTYISYANQSASLVDGWISYCLLKLKKDTQYSALERWDYNAHKIAHKTPYPQALAEMVKCGSSSLFSKPAISEGGNHHGGFHDSH